MTKNSMFENALLSLPWKTGEDIDQLISLGAKVKKEDAFELISKAIESNNPDLVKKVLKLSGGVLALRKLDSIEYQGWNEYQLLKNAIKNSDISVLKTLVENGFNVKAASSPHQNKIVREGHSPAFDHRYTFVSLITYCEDDTQKKDYLLKKGCNPITPGMHYDRKYGHELMDCIYKNDVNRLTTLLKEGYNPNTLVDMNDALYSPLMEAIIQNKPQIARVLLFHGGLAKVGKDRYTLYEAVDKYVGNFHGISSLTPKDAKEWETLTKLDKMLGEKFAHLAFREGVAQSRKKALIDILSASSKSEVREIVRKFHEENPKQRTALKFKKDKQAEK